MSEFSVETLPGNKETGDGLPAPAPPPGRAQMGRPLDYWLLWLVALGSLALNVWLLNTLLTIQRQVADARLQMAQGVIEAADAVGRLDLGTVEYVIHVDEEIPLDISVPISDTLSVPISHTVRVNSAAVINIPLIGRQSLPFSVNVPVNLDVTIPISRTYTVTDTIPILFDVPISISLDDTALGGLKGELRAYLLELAEEIKAPPGAP